MEILDLIDALEELVIQARRLPVGGNLVVDRKRMLDIVDQFRLAVPADIREASRVIETREQVLQEAHQQAQQMISAAEAERARRLDQNEIVADAHERSQAMLRDAESRARVVITEADATAATHLSEAADAARKQLDDADQYAHEILRRLESQLQAFLDSIRQGIASLEQRR